METLYFLFPICATVALICFAINRVNSRKHLRRLVAARTAAARPVQEPQGAPGARTSMEQRYVDWFTDDRSSRARERALRNDEEECLVGSAVMAGGMSYQPSETAPVANF